MSNLLMKLQKSGAGNRQNNDKIGDVMLIRSLVFLSVSGLLLAACGEKEDDTGTDSAEVVDTASDDDSAAE